MQSENQFQIKDDMLAVSVSPHVFSNLTTQKIMLDVLISLMPALLAGTIIFGFRALAVFAVCMISCVLSEYLFNLCCKREQTIKDLSAAVTGMLLALNLPANIPLWQAAIGSIFAIVIVKSLFGGLGQNFANPAITARVFMLISFGTMTKASMPVIVDTVATATPLPLLKGEAAGELPSLLDMFLGNRGGAIGESCILALLIGGIYLLVRKVITFHTPLAFIGTVFVLSFAVTGSFISALYYVMAGGVVLGAFFMATDYVTTPTTYMGQVFFGIGCGLITVLIRFLGSYPEGVSFAILLMNILTPFIEKWTAKKTLGGKRR